MKYVGFCSKLFFVSAKWRLFFSYLCEPELLKKLYLAPQVWGSCRGLVCKASVSSRWAWWLWFVTAHCRCTTEHDVVLKISRFRANAIYFPFLLCTLRPQTLCTLITDCFARIFAWCSSASIQLYFSGEKKKAHFTNHYMTFEITRLLKEFHIGLELYTHQPFY